MADILDQYVMNKPSHQSAIDLFEGEWSSRIPGPFQSGNMPLFSDKRLIAIAEAAGGLAGKNILELGPLEAGHTTAMSNMGAARITAIEANSRAYLKCLIVKEILNLKNVSFLIGDFDLFLDDKPRFDFILACGVIYHCINPVRTLVNLCHATDQIGIWSHYYLEDEVRNIYGNRFKHEPVVKEYEGFTVPTYEHQYKHALNIKGFCGGGNASTFWMPMEGWNQILDGLGFDLEILSSSTDHPHGPEFTGIAKRRNA